MQETKRGILEKELLTLPKMGFTEVRVARSLVFCVVLYRSMFVLSHLAIV
jgi:hypothetical protein